MNILEAIVQLRDDIKTWVTNNLNALNSKIDEKTIPVDNELSNTSTNPVQNKVVSAQIDYIVDELLGGEKVSDTVDKAIASQKHFSGDYNDLTNAPNISEDGSGDMVIADESGNIIFKVDEEGVHTTDVEVDGTSLAAKIPVWDAKSNFSGNYNDLVGAPDIAEDGAGNMIVTDESGNIIAQVDENGFKTTIVQANQVKIDGQDVVEMIENHTIAIDDTLSDTSTNPVQNKTIYNKLEELTDMKPVSEQIATAIVNHKYDYNDLTNAPDIKEDGEGNMIVADEGGNIIFQVDAGGINTTAIKIANQNVLDIMDEKVAALVESAPATLDTLNELAAALGDDPNFATTIATQIGGKVDKVNGMGLSEANFTTAEKNKLAAIEDGANKTVVEIVLSDTSENPVQSKVIYEKLDELTGMEPVSSQISSAIGSITHPVTSVNGKIGAVTLQYEDIENAPNISEDESGDLVITDPDGNIIFRSDGSGFETTNLVAQTLIINGKDIGAAVENKVDKEEGKDLSSNDFTDEDKEKLDKLGTFIISVEEGIADKTNNNVIEFFTSTQSWNIELHEQVSNILNGGEMMLPRVYHLNIVKMATDLSTLTFNFTCIENAVLYECIVVAFASTDKQNELVSVAFISNNLTGEDPIDQELITVDDIDQICSSTIQAVNATIDTF